MTERTIGLSRVHDHIGNPDPDEDGQSTADAVIQWVERTMNAWGEDQRRGIDLRAQLATAGIANDLEQAKQRRIGYEQGKRDPEDRLAQVRAALADADRGRLEWRAEADDLRAQLATARADRDEARALAEYWIDTPWRGPVANNPKRRLPWVNSDATVVREGNGEIVAYGGGFWNKATTPKEPTP